MERHYEAVLMMASRGLANSLRRAKIYDPWSQLYRAGEAYYLDLSLTPVRKGAVLRCQVLTIDGEVSTLAGQVELFAGEQPYLTQTFSDGAFELEVTDAGNYLMKVTLGETTIRVASLDIR